MARLITNLCIYSLLFIAAARAADGPASPAYTGSAECAACHPTIAKTYRLTGMARSFGPAGEAPPGLAAGGRATFFHETSRRWYGIYPRDGAMYVRRYQIDAGGRETNLIEARADYVLGSGNHARALVAREPDGRLIQLPVAWYAEGRAWGMAPGYDRPDHADFRRAIDGECMFCHNGYPLQPVRERPGAAPVYPARLPAGIDCERCHGPGSDHVRGAKGDGTAAAIRAAILNPARLPAERQLEICMQCHLQPTSRALPSSVRRAGRAVLSYNPREPLAAYMMFFDRTPPKEDGFEVNHAAYRLRRSACFRASGGRLVCTTCHNPHDIPRGHAAEQHYAKVCRDCHRILQREHTSDTNCISCHMPKRRTEDATHVTMTDHRIARAPGVHTLRRFAEARDDPYRGEVALYYPPDTARARDELEIAVAQVREAANLRTGIPRLSGAIEQLRPVEPEYRYELAEAYRKFGNGVQAAREYKETLRRAPGFAPAWLGLGQALVMSGRLADAIGELRQGLLASAPHPPLLNFLGSVQQQAGDLAASVTVLREAIAAAPELPEPHLNLGVAFAQQGQVKAAEDAFREAIRRAPDLAAAHNNLAYLLAALARPLEAQQYFEEAIRLDPDYWAAHLNYGRLLTAAGRTAKAAEHFRKAARSPDAGLRGEALAALAGRPAR
jgi:predicted CXXCH cytochrome family protein